MDGGLGVEAHRRGRAIGGQVPERSAPAEPGVVDEERRLSDQAADVGDEPSRILVMFAPAGMERFFERHARLPPGPVDPDAYRAIAHDCAMEVVGRPLAESDPI